MNGTAERVWGTLKPKARCLLNSTSLGHKLWPYAYLYAAHLYNRSYVQRIDSTPFFKIFNKKPSLAKLERFGSDMFCAKDKPSCNLETRAEKGKFVGFSELSGGVFMYLPEEGCVITRAYSDCLFLEPAVTPTRGSQPDLSNPATPLSRDNSPHPLVIFRNRST